VKIATWNVNSVKARLPNLLVWLQESAPDVVLLQETKTLDEAFPCLEIEDLGYNLAFCGQKTYNGVAILSKFPIALECGVLPGDDSDDQARYIEGITNGVRVASIYLPNGNPVNDGPHDSEKFAYKLAWMERLYDHIQSLLAFEDVFVLGGDYNVIAEDGDVFDPEGWKNDALYRPETRGIWRKIIYLGLTNAYRALNHEYGRYSWWDYRAGAWAKDHGALIDHLLLSPQAADRLAACDIDRKPRGMEKASDHTPVWCRLKI
jgi:exodeoxyribonuclease III